jgi:hypothetical protein
VYSLESWELYAVLLKRCQSTIVAVGENSVDAVNSCCLCRLSARESLPLAKVRERATMTAPGATVFQHLRAGDNGLIVLS